MSENKKDTQQKDASNDNGKLSEMNDENAAKKETTTGVAKDKGTLGKMNDEA